MKGLMGKLETFLKKNGSTILSCLAAGGVIGTMALTVKATTKAYDAINKEERDRGVYYEYDRIAKTYLLKPTGKLTKKEKLKIAAPHFITPGLFALGTIGCIFGANVLNKKAQASLISAYALLDESYKQYRENTNTLYGTDADRKIKLAMAEGAYEDGDLKTVNDSGQVVFVDNTTLLSFNATPLLIEKAIQEVNDKLQVKGQVFVYEWLEALGLPAVDDDFVTGWSEGYLRGSGYETLQFDIEKCTGKDGEEFYVIFPMVEPNMWMYL